MAHALGKKAKNARHAALNDTDTLLSMIRLA
jgi:hypothetical protein